MSRSNVLLPQGGIPTGTNVYILGVYQNDLYVMTQGIIANNAVMFKVYTNSANGPTLNASLASILNFTITYNGDALIIRTSNQRYLSPSNEILALQTTVPPLTEPIFFNQGTYADFSTPSLILSSVPYRVFGSSANIALQVRLEDGTTTAMPLIIVPTTYYQDCSSGNTSTVTSIQSIFNTVYCSHFDQTWCSSGVDRNGWVDESDCLVGNTYTYCVNGTSCTGNCKSACLDSPINYTCDYTGNAYECLQLNINEDVLTPSSGSTAPLAPVEDSGWTIIIIIVGIIIVILLIAGAVMYQRRRSNRLTTSPYMQEHHHYMESRVSNPPSAPVPVGYTK